MFMYNLIIDPLHHSCLHYVLKKIYTPGKNIHKLPDIFDISDNKLVFVFNTAINWWESSLKETER